ncbi:serine hydrolase domain-containing protein [Limnohabitans sp.]|jgi:CubicO group peptidase (beta-lactamase class C family)|uniref:serine hydrolase domain-containing protein n=1 Tax=Limnohabitans sp. TaxID=1907725 RepID=UPI00391DFFC2
MKPLGRWAVLAWVLGGAMCPLLGAQTLSQRKDGPGAERLGIAQNYQGCAEAMVREVCRVGTWSANHTFAPSRTVAPSAQPSALLSTAVAPEIRWRWGLSRKTVDDFMQETQTTGLLVIHKGQVVAERYQYARQPDMRMRSFSMAKTVTALLVGIAHDKGLIRSLDDTAATYWPEITPSAYGQTTIRNLLRMASGIPFRELYTWTADDDLWVWGRVLHQPANRDQSARVAEHLNQRTTREVEQGTRFRYATIETEILGRVLSKATGQNLSVLTQQWLWQPMGAEHEAHWLFATTDGVESAGGGFNATLRDYGRLGLLLAQDGQREGRQIIPRAFLLEATDLSSQPSAFQPRTATPYMGYGYQTWLLPFKVRTFALQGIHGQSILVQPASGIVVVQTSVNDKASGYQDPRPYQLRDAFWRGVLQSLGGSVD